MNPIELDTQLCRQLPPWYREIVIGNPPLLPYLPIW